MANICYQIFFFSKSDPEQGWFNWTIVEFYEQVCVPLNQKVCLKQCKISNM